MDVGFAGISENRQSGRCRVVDAKASRLDTYERIGSQHVAPGRTCRAGSVLPSTPSFPPLLRPTVQLMPP